MISKTNFFFSFLAVAKGRKKAEVLEVIGLQLDD